MLRAPQAAFSGGARPIEGGDWMIGPRRYRLNPRHATPQAAFAVVRLWYRCRAGMGGIGTWPEPGGVNQQPAWLCEAFGFLAGEEAEAEKRDEAEGKAS